MVGVLTIRTWRQRQSREGAETRIQETPPALYQSVDPGPSPDSVVETRPDHAEIVQLLESVSSETCDIYLAHRAGYSYDEIADLTGFSHRRIRRHIGRGLLAIMEDQARVDE